MPLKAVLFDMDGVIVDTEPLHTKAYYKMFEDYGLEVTPELFATFTGASTRKVCNTLIEKFGLQATHEELAADKRKYFKHYFDTDPDFDLIPGVRALIEHYHKNGVTLVLASSASMNTINWVFEKFDLNKFFKAKISGADLRESKPHPEIFEKAAELAGEPRENCMVIEDSTNGIKAAKEAGIFCAAYKSPHTHGQDYAGADIVVGDFAELRSEQLASHFQ